MSATYNSIIVRFYCAAIVYIANNILQQDASFYAHTHMCVHMPTRPSYTHACTRVHTRVHVHAHTHVHTCTQTYTHSYIIYAHTGILLSFRQHDCAKSRGSPLLYSERASSSHILVNYSVRPPGHGRPLRV